MKQIYIIAALLYSFCCFSQLYIAPGKSDSYVYAEGAMIYVEKEIDLRINPSDNLKASIYLRNESQLLQGDASGANTGNGYLSVFQEGKASAYTYNYWGSPVKDVSATKTFGNIFFEPLDKTYSKKAIITGELNGSSSPLKISDRWIYKFTGNTYRDWKYIGNIFDIAPGEGFTMKGVDGINTAIVLYGIVNNPGNAQRYDFRGLPNNGTLILGINRDQLKLIGNPYPSALDLRTFLMDNPSLTGVAYFWDSASVDSHFLNEYEGGYGAFAPIGPGLSAYVPAAFSTYDTNGEPVSETGEGGNYYARYYAPIAQGFMVEGRFDGNIRFENSQRVFQKETRLSSEFKDQHLKEPLNTPEDIAALRLNISFNKRMVRQLLLVNHSDATSGIDHAMDARNISLMKNDIGWNLKNLSYLINVLPLRDSTEIPLLINISDHVITEFMVPVNNLSGELHILDNKHRTYHKIGDEPLKFSVDSEDDPGRFQLVFTKQTENGSPEPTVPDNNYLIAQNNHESLLQIRATDEQPPLHIALYDNAGRKILSREVKDQRRDHEFSTHNLSNGVYIVKIRTEKGLLISKKIIISN